MIPKIKKALKKSLIKIYSESKEFDLRLESSLKANSMETEAIFSSHLTGSNKGQFVLSLKLNNENIKLPAILKMFSVSYDLKLFTTLQKDSLGAKAFVIHRVNNLILKSKKYDFAFRSYFEFCVKLKVLIDFPLLKGIISSSKKNSTFLI
jgi:hypothetical protein